MDGAAGGGPPGAGRGAGGRGAALLAAMRSKAAKKPGEMTDVSQAASEVSSATGRLDNPTQSMSQAPVGRGALLSRLSVSGSTSASASTGAVGRQALLEKLRIKQATQGVAGAGDNVVPLKPVGRAALVTYFILHLAHSYYLTFLLRLQV